VTPYKLIREGDQAPRIFWTPVVPGVCPVCAVPTEAEEKFDDLDIGVIANRLALVRDGAKLGRQYKM